MTTQQYIILTALIAFQFSWGTVALWSIDNDSFMGYMLTLPLWAYVTIKAVWLVGGES